MTDSNDDVQRPKLQQRKQFERPHVLILSDDESLSAFLNEGLPLGGFWTSVIASGLQALEVFRLRQFDLIVVDRGLQSFDAMEFIRRLRGLSDRAPNDSQRTRAPLVVVSETDPELAAEERQRLQIDAVVIAPIEIDAFARQLHEVFDAWSADHPDVPLADSADARAR